jgi:hypothetical protein
VKVRGRLSVAALLILCLLLAGCKRDAEIEAALTELDAFTGELTRLIDRGGTLPEGVDNAQQYLDSRKREIKSKAAFLARVRGIQASEATEKKLIETVRRDQMTISSLPSQKPYSELYTANAAFKTKLDKLINDYLELFLS